MIDVLALFFFPGTFDINCLAVNIPHAATHCRQPDFLILSLFQYLYRWVSTPDPIKHRVGGGVGGVLLGPHIFFENVFAFLDSRVTQSEAHMKMMNSDRRLQQTLGKNCSYWMNSPSLLWMSLAPTLSFTFLCIKVEQKTLANIFIAHWPLLYGTGFESQFSTD